MRDRMAVGKTRSNSLGRLIFWARSIGLSEGAFFQSREGGQGILIVVSSEPVIATAFQPEVDPPAPQAPRAAASRRATMSPEALERARSKDRVKYARRMERDSVGFRSKRREIQNRYYRRRHRRSGVQVDLVC
jgi:hypothetical protein